MAMTAPKVDSSDLWRRTLEVKGDMQEIDRSRLRVSLLSFRFKVSHIVSSIGSELAGLTVHDITHLDALWTVADEIIGPNYPVNEAEAYVLGGAFLLHDAAHAVCAYEGGVAELKSSTEWRDYVAIHLSGVEPDSKSDQEKLALFHVLRELHAHQAQNLPEMVWASPDGEREFLIEDTELRNYYGQVIGEVAASHHWDPSAVVDRFRNRKLTPPGFMNSSAWSVDVLKVAMILRLSDAAHIDSGRAPWFLFALRKPEGVSKQHWKFQSDIGKVSRTSEGELKITSGRAFKPNESEAWWLAWDVGNMIDRELKACRLLLRQEGRAPFEAIGVQGVSSPSAFAQHVPVSNWEPVDVRPKVGNLPYLIESLGGAALYGDSPDVAVRELIQNAVDACRALDTLLDSEESKIRIELNKVADDRWVLAVTDTGVGMSRYALTEVLLDFGRSMWSSEIGRELPGLASAGFRSAGKFGIGFFSIFMLGEKVSVVTRRFERSHDDNSDQWKLDFQDGLRSRPSLSIPRGGERLKQCGTKVSVEISKQVVEDLLVPLDADDDSLLLSDLTDLVTSQIPASPIEISLSVNRHKKTAAIAPNDWWEISDDELLSRTGIRRPTSRGIKKLIDLHDSQGTLVGRVLPAARWSGHAVGTLHGVRATTVSGLVGVVRISANNTNLIRTQAPLFAETPQWVDWAKRVEVEIAEDDVSRLLILNAMLPDRDYKVWKFRGEGLTLEMLSAELKNIDVLDLHLGEVGHSDEDEASSSSFSVYFVPGHDLLVGPDSYYQVDGNDAHDDEAFPWKAGFERLDYVARLRKVISEVWGKFEEDFFSVSIGSVQGVDIYRDVIRFSRASTPSVGTTRTRKKKNARPA